LRNGTMVHRYSHSSAFFFLIRPLVFHATGTLLARPGWTREGFPLSTATPWLYLSAYHSCQHDGISDPRRLASRLTICEPHPPSPPPTPLPLSPVRLPAPTIWVVTLSISKRRQLSPSSPHPGVRSTTITRSLLPPYDILERGWPQPTVSCITLFFYDIDSHLRRQPIIVHSALEGNMPYDVRRFVSVHSRLRTGPSPDPRP
jgi:hypothetical protein